MSRGVRETGVLNETNQAHVASNRNNKYFNFLSHGWY